MREEDVKLLTHFLNYFQNESDRGTALIGAAMIDSKLERILDIVLINNKSREGIFEGPNSLFGNFSSKIKMCHLLGIITDKECEEIHMIRKIRNEFAHKLDDLSFNDQPIKDYCLTLKASTPGDLKTEKKYRNLFTNSVILTTLSLWYRPDYAKGRLNIKKTNWEYSL